MGASLTLFKRDPETDFYTLLQTVHNGGYGWSEIARMGGWDDSTVRWWAKKPDCIPNYEDGKLLIQIFRVVFKRDPPTKAFYTPEAANRYA